MPCFFTLRTGRIGVVLACALLSTPPSVSAQQIALRVRLLSDQPVRAITVYSHREGLRIYAPGRQERLALVPARQRITLAVGRSPALERAGDRIWIRTNPLDTLTLEHAGVRRAYRGEIEVQARSDGSLWVINIVDLEDYIASVVGAEMPFSELEALKAQAVLARTYAVATLHRFLSLGYHIEDHQFSQLYLGLATERPLARRAALETYGELLTYEGRPIEAVYASTCGGHTAANEEAWPAKALPYLRPLTDPFCEHSPHARWRTVLTKEALLGALERALKRRITDVGPFEYGPSGRVVSVWLQGPEPMRLSGTQFRTLVSDAFGWRALRSTRFIFSFQAREVHIEGNGLGHGVGLCQYGAQGRARTGQNYKQILEAYYPGTRLVSLFSSAPLAAHRP
ncbi:MAG: SpoIID/LytB domain-containing protein [Bacteroidota bacterium]|nr:SpoIID/LytB domain-containing protein [Rhodothermia bacterium]MDW8285771.1 SpoIID/LytB domain-containing protein [Bacteroidota bacterium]